MGVELRRQIGTYTEDGCIYPETDNTDEVQFAYSGFHHFRKRLAAAVEIDLDAMAGFTGREVKGRPWSEVHTDLAPLLNHSDCDGELSPAESARVLSVVRELDPAELFPGDQENFERDRLRQLVTLLGNAVEQQQTIVFT